MKKFIFSIFVLSIIAGITINYTTVNYKAEQEPPLFSPSIVAEQIPPIATLPVIG